MKLFRLVISCISVSVLACTKPCIKDPVEINLPIECNTWSRLWGGTAVDAGSAIANTPDGGYIIAGSTSSTDGDIPVQFGNGDIIITRINSLGVKQWQRSYGTSNEETAAAIVPAMGGGYVILSNQNTTGPNGPQLYIFHINEQGDIIWEQTWQGPGYTMSNALLAHGPEYVIMASTSNSSDVQPWFIKLDFLGNIIAEKTFGNSQRAEFPNSVIPADDGSSYLVSGFTLDRAGSDAWTTKLDFFGDWEWERFTNGGDVDEWMDAVPAADGTGDYLLVGQSNSIDGDVSGNHGGYDVMVARIGAAGNIKWRQLLGGSDNEQGLSIIKAVDGSYVIAGTTKSGDGNVGSRSPAAENKGGWVFKMDATGRILSQKVLGGSLEDQPTALISASDCGFVLVGYSLSNNGDLNGNHKEGTSDIWVAKFAL